MKKQKNSPSQIDDFDDEFEDDEIELYSEELSDELDQTIKLTFGSSDGDEPEQSLNLSNHFF